MNTSTSPAMADRRPHAKTLARLQGKYEKVIGLFTLARCRGRIDEAAIPAIVRSLQRLAGHLDVDYDALAAAAARENCAGETGKVPRAPERGKASQRSTSRREGPERKTPETIPPASEEVPRAPDRMSPHKQDYPSELPPMPGTYGPHEALPLKVYVERTRPHIISQWINGAEGRIRLMEKTAPNLVGPTRALIERARTDSLLKEEAASILREQKLRFDNSGGVMSEQERLHRIQDLQRIAGAEESKDEQFFPTPLSVIEENVVPNLMLQPGMHILEPSAGRGDIADAIRNACPDCRIDVAEIGAVRRELLELKGYRVVGSDFWNVGVTGAEGDKGRSLDERYKGSYDAVAMNPPFDKGVGMAHVKRAYEFLRPGGRLVAILPARNLNGTSREAVSFQDWTKRHGAENVVYLDAKEYARAMERAIVLPVAILVMVKPETTARARSEGDDYRSVMKTLETPPKQAAVSTEPDTAFVPPRIITANEALTKAPERNIIPAHLSSLPFIQSHVIQGANLAIESLDESGGFLLADGTGVGKTLQCLLVAEHYARTTGEPVLIMTADDRIMETVFFEDARKLGFATPEAASQRAASVPKRPKGYTGLYDAAAPTMTVWRHSFDTALRPGINIATYHMLSQYREGGELLVSIDEANTELREVERMHMQARRDALDDLDRQYPKNPKTRRREPEGYKAAKETRLRELSLYYNRDHPVHVRLREAQDAYTAFIKEAIQRFAATTQLVILDEAHKLKNAGDGAEGASRRALLGLTIINYCPRVMYVTATPADRPTDILYLKRAGLFRDDSQFARLMGDLGYVWEAAVTNKDGIVIRLPAWRARAQRGSVDHMRRAVSAMSGAFDMLTEDGHMLRREIELTNLTVRFHRFEAPNAALDTMDRVKAAYTYTDDRGREFEDVVSIFSRQMEELEPYKLPMAVQLVDDAMQNGRQVIVFVHTAEEGKDPRKATGDIKPGAVRIVRDTLARRYGEDAVGVIAGASGEYESYRRLENVRQFQAGQRRILIGTITSGGTGLSLDDTTGSNPREMIIVTPPLSYIHVMQAIGRVVRANTKSVARVNFIFTSNTGIDTWLSAILATKFAALSAIIKGESHRLNTDTMHQLEETGEAGAASLIAEKTMDGTGDEVVRRHSRLSKVNQRIEGWSLPSGLPYYAELSGGATSGLIAFGGRTPEDLRLFIENNKDWIEKWRLSLNPNKEYARYHGPYLGREFYNRDWAFFTDTWEAVLNAVDYEVLSIPTFTESPYHVGDMVRFMQDVPRAEIMRGTVGRIVKERKPRITGDQWLYDVEVAGKDVAKAIEYYKLGHANAPKPRYRPGMRWKGIAWGSRGRDEVFYFTIASTDGLSVSYYRTYPAERIDRDRTPETMSEHAWTEMVEGRDFERIGDDETMHKEDSKSGVRAVESAIADSADETGTAASYPSLSDADADIRRRVRQAMAEKGSVVPLSHTKGRTHGRTQARVKGESHADNDVDGIVDDAVQSNAAVASMSRVPR